MQFSVAVKDRICCNKINEFFNEIVTPRYGRSCMTWPPDQVQQMNGILSSVEKWERCYSYIDMFILFQTKFLDIKSTNQT